ncbi:MAG: SiaB family protein kinase [Bacteroidetes bacterium]|jgi:hypothetical protein|nr:SiaB family protein kinase [Bacteroidota bacterium]
MAELFEHEQVLGMMRTGRDQWFYCGEVSDDLINSLVSAVDAKPELQAVSRPARRRLLSALVECLQNMRNNTPTVPNESVPNSIVLISKISDYEYGLRCGNIMLTADVPELDERIKKINSADQEQIKEMYMKQMSVVLGDGNRKSAGLGLLEIARSAAGKIEYRFIDMDGGFTFFCVEVNVQLN